MPTAMEIVNDGRGLRLIGSGILTGAEMIAATNDLEANPDLFRRLVFGLVDLREVTELRLTGEDVKALAHMDRRLALVNPSLCVAVVAPKGVVFGMARMWEVLAEPTGWPTAVFRDMADAEIWIEARKNSFGG